MKAAIKQLKLFAVFAVMVLALADNVYAQSGGFLTDLVKYHKLNKASDSMNEINYLMQKLSRELGSLEIPNDYRMQLGGFLTFADFFFDGVFVDAYMTSKIMNSLDEVQKLKERLYILKSKLEQM